MELDLQFFDQEPVIEDEEEPSVLEYAREQGICVDYTRELPQFRDINVALQRNLDQDLRDPFDDEIANAIAAATELTRQRLAVTKEVALLLKSVLLLQEAPADDPLATDGRQHILDMKQELPVLQTDAELDMLHFGTKVEPDFRDLRTRLPSEDLDDENDEGFAWPTKYFSYPAQCDAKIKNERLAVTRGVLAFLQSAVRDEYTAEDHEQIMAKGLESKRDITPRHLTPPLLPLSPELAPYIPSSPANRLPLASESSDSVTAEVKALERQIMANDSLARHHSGSSDSMLLDVADPGATFDTEAATSPHFSDRIPTILKRRAENLKVEGPLTPPILSDSPMKKLKSVSFAKMIQVGHEIESWTDERRPGTSDSRSSTDELPEGIEPLANEAKRRVENEKLTGADTTARVEVPDVDFTLPVAPWNEYSLRKGMKNRADSTELEAQMRFLLHVKRDDLKLATTWRGVSDLDLKWGWFMSPTATIKLNKKLHGETEFSRVQAELTSGNIATSSNEVWKREGLRILDEEDHEEEEELELGEFEERNDMEALIRKRKLELEEQEEVLETQRRKKEAATQQMSTKMHIQSLQEAAESPHWDDRATVSHHPRSLYPTLASSRPQQSQIPSSQLRAAKEQKKEATELMFGEFSASTALQKFMQTQGKAIKYASTAASPQAKAPPAQTLPVRSIDSSDEQSPFVAQTPGPTTILPGEHPSRKPPSLDLPPCSFITSTMLLRRRTFMKQIEQLYPKAEFVYRDYDLLHSVSPEADFILSPSTGLIFTTLQQIKQVPLPGQVARSPAKERMAALQARYERLVVLISEGLSREMEELGSSRPEDVRDKETLKELETFAAQLEGNVIVHYVRGGERALARSIVESMGKHGLPHCSKDLGDIKVLPVETTWEIFLRRAGLNPFATQVIIASLKHPTTIQLPPLLSSSPPYQPQRSVQVAGLSTFLLMDGDERITRFQALMGGRRILGRVNRLLDQQWLSAAHGFRM